MNHALFALLNALLAAVAACPESDSNYWAWQTALDETKAALECDQANIARKHVRRAVAAMHAVVDDRTECVHGDVFAQARRAGTAALFALANAT